MKTVNEVSKLTGVSIRTLQYYDQIGLLKPACYTEAGYRLYDEEQLETLQQILFFRELEFPLKEIKDIIKRPDFDRDKALDQQIELLTLKKEHLEKLIRLARSKKKGEMKTLDFSAFSNEKIEEYKKKAKEQWGQTPQFQEFEKKDKARSKEDEKNMLANFMKIFEEFGEMKEMDPASEEVSAQVAKLKAYISDHFYNCSNDILLGLGKMYAAGGEFTENIDKAGGEGTAVFTCKAIEVYNKKVPTALS